MVLVGEVTGARAGALRGLAGVATGRIDVHPGSTQSAGAAPGGVCTLDVPTMIDASSPMLWSPVRVAPAAESIVKADRLESQKRLPWSWPTALVS